MLFSWLAVGSSSVVFKALSLRPRVGYSSGHCDTRLLVSCIVKAVENGWVSERLTPGFGEAVRVPMFPAQDSRGSMGCF